MCERKYLAFDIETVKEFPDGAGWRDYRPLGIGCAAACSVDMPEPLRWHDCVPGGNGIAERMSRDSLAALVRSLAELAGKGYTLLTWNGAGFDFDVLAEESGLRDECQQLALSHVDMMFHLFCTKGYPLALKTASKGMGLPGKTEGMDGAAAVRMWADPGAREQVVDYCAQDVRATLELALACEKTGRLNWTSRKGNPMRLGLPRGWRTVRESLCIPEPDNSWMTNPLERSAFTGWLS